MPSINKFSLLFENHLNNSIATLKNLQSALATPLFEAAQLLADCIRGGGKILIAGNGGSAADAQHIAAEFVVRLSHNLERPAIPAIALTTDSSILTAGGNDIGFEKVFARQVEALATQKDIFWAISTSGNSPNIVKAAEQAGQAGCKTIAFLGGSGGKMRELADVAVIVPSSNTQHIQEGHICLYHILVEFVERSLYESGQ